MTPKKRRLVLSILSAYVALVFVQSLFYKFTDSVETRYIFATLNAWALSWGAPPVFAPQGIFGQYVVGSAELLASVLLGLGLWRAWPRVHVAGTALALGVISGALAFHLFTPLGVQVLNADGRPDGGQLFMLALGVWLASALMLWLQREAWRPAGKS